MEIVLATRNTGKIEEIRYFFGLKFPDIILRNLDEFPDMPDELEETGETYEENALQKARFVSERTGLWTLADDSGLEVRALNGAPGVYSRRYSEEGTDAANVEKLLRELACAHSRDKILSAVAGEPYWFDERSAAYVSCAILIRPDGKYFVGHGCVQGYIRSEPCGNFGFGYDSVFGFLDKPGTLAEMSQRKRFLNSHRVNALRDLNIKEVIGDL